MNKIPASVDELMWLIAEQGEAAAVEAFSRRYPEYRHELIKRLNMLHDLVGAKGSVRNGARAIPVFQRRENRPRTQMRSVLSTVTAISALLAVACTSFYVTKQLATSKANHPPVQSKVNHLPIEGHNAGPRVEPAQPSKIEQAQQGNAQPLEAIYSKAITIKVDEARLSHVFKAISAASGLKLELAPGMPDPMILVDYKQAPCLEVLHDMGRRIGFTALEQGQGQVLIVPARDPNENVKAPQQIGITALDPRPE